MAVLENIILPVVLIILIIAMVLMIANGRKDGKERHYDEMQLKIRGDGYKLGYFVTLAGLALLAVLTEASEGFSRTVAPTLGIFVVIMAGIISFVVYCIFKEAFFSVGQNGKSYMILCVVIIACNAAGSLREFGEMAAGTFPENGRLTYSSCGNLVAAASFLVVLIALIVKYAQSGKEEAE